MQEVLVKGPVVPKEEVRLVAEARDEAPAPGPERTKGEVLVQGLELIRDGLQLLAGLGAPVDIVKTIVGSQGAAQRLRDVLREGGVLYALVLEMVKARNPRLSGDTVAKVVADFLAVLFDLSRPYRPAGK